jgi:hypothetical protein
VRASDAPQLEAKAYFTVETPLILNLAKGETIELAVNIEDYEPDSQFRRRRCLGLDRRQSRTRACCNLVRPRDSVHALC